MSTAGGYAFDAFRLDVRSSRVLRDGQPIDLSPRQFRILHALVTRAGEVVPKNVLIAAGWQDTAVSDSSLEKVVFEIRRRLDPDHLDRFIVTVPRQGYRFSAPVEPWDDGETDARMAALAAPFGLWNEGLAALEALGAGHMGHARALLEMLVTTHPAEAKFRIGLANVCAMQREMTRTDEYPNDEALARAVLEAVEGCRLKPESALGWSTLGFVQELSGAREDAARSHGRAMALRSGEWRILYRCGAFHWGRERLDAARDALDECPGLPVACFLVASVYVGRQSLARAERELDAARAAVVAEAAGTAVVSIVGYYWLKALLCAIRGAIAEALANCDLELALESRGHVYGREVAANTLYLKGALLLRLRERDASRACFIEAIRRVPLHPGAHGGLAILDGAPDLVTSPADAYGTRFAIERAYARSGVLSWGDDRHRAAEIAAAAIAAEPPGNAGWLLALEPLINVQQAPEVWAPVLAMLAVRAR